MKYFGMPMGMWGLFSGSFRAQLRTVFGYDADEARRIAKAAKAQRRSSSLQPQTSAQRIPIRATCRYRSG